MSPDRRNFRGFAAAASLLFLSWPIAVRAEEEVGKRLSEAECAAVFARFGDFVPKARLEGLESSIELEMGNIPQVMAMLTTSNGKLSGLIEHKRLDTEWKEELRALFPAYREDLGEVPWEKIPEKLQKELISFAHQNQSFWEDRNIHGLTFRERVEAFFDKPVAVFGKKFLAGMRRIPIREIFGKFPIQFMSPRALKNFAGPRGGIEAHLRQAVPPSQNWRDSRLLVRALGIKPGPVHQHVIGKIREGSFIMDPTLDITRLLEYHRRLNLYTEMLKIQLGNAPQEVVEEGAGILFDSLHPSNLGYYFGGFSDFLKHGAPKTKPERYLSFVSMRLPGTYDQRDVFGPGVPYPFPERPCGDSAEA